MIGVNLKGAFLVGQAVARAMAGTGGGAIVNMSSVNGMLTIPTIASYNVSKGGINQLTRVMALALADRGVRVNAVAPGTIATELAKAAVLTSDDATPRIMSRTPMKRLGEPSEIADVVAFLLSDAASYVTGEIVTVDGGRMTLNYTMPGMSTALVLPCGAGRPRPARPNPPAPRQVPDLRRHRRRLRDHRRPALAPGAGAAGLLGALVRPLHASSSPCSRSWSRLTKAASCWPS